MARKGRATAMQNNSPMPRRSVFFGTGRTSIRIGQTKKKLLCYRLWWTSSWKAGNRQSVVTSFVITWQNVQRSLFLSSRTEGFLPREEPTWLHPHRSEQHGAGLALQPDTRAFCFRASTGTKLRRIKAISENICNSEMQQCCWRKIKRKAARCLAGWGWLMSPALAAADQEIKPRAVHHRHGRWGKISQSSGYQELSLLFQKPELSSAYRRKTQLVSMCSQIH